MRSAFDSLKKIATSSKKILLLSQEKPTLDMAASLLGLAGFLQKNGGQVSLLMPEEILSSLFFLEKNFPIVSRLSHARDFILIFNTEKNPIANIRTEKNKTQCLIRISPEKGVINPKDFSFLPADFNYDWLFLVGVPSLEKVGAPYFDNPDLFFELPKINLDNQNDNEAYAQINLVDGAACSIGEIVAGLLLDEQPEILDPSIAKALLTAIIAGTDSFQNPATSPQSLITAARLMKYGVNQGEIVRHLYRNKNLPFLKLWGKAMAHLEWQEKTATVHSWISQEDFLSSQAEPKDISLILKEIQKNFSSAKICLIFYINEKDEICGEILFSPNQKRQAVCLAFGQPPEEKLELNFGRQKLADVKKEVLDKIARTEQE